MQAGPCPCAFPFLFLFVCARATIVPSIVLRCVCDPIPEQSQSGSSQVSHSLLLTPVFFFKPSCPTRLLLFFNLRPHINFSFCQSLSIQPAAPRTKTTHTICAVGCILSASRYLPGLSYVPRPIILNFSLCHSNHAPFRLCYIASSVPAPSCLGILDRLFLLI